MCALHSKELLCCFRNFSSWREAAMNPRHLVQHHDHLLTLSPCRAAYCFYTPTSPSLCPSLKLLCFNAHGLHPFLEGTAIIHVLRNILSIHRHHLQLNYLNSNIIIPSWVIPKLPVFPTHYLWRLVLRGQRYSWIVSLVLNSVISNLFSSP